MKNDEEIITLRNNIKKSAQAKVANGTLTVTEMLREVTAENIAMQDKSCMKFSYCQPFTN